MSGHAGAAPAVGEKRGAAEEAGREEHKASKPDAAACKFALRSGAFGNKGLKPSLEGL